MAAYDDKYLDNEIQLSYREIQEWDFDLIHIARLASVVRAYETVAKSNGEGHPWAGRVQRTLGRIKTNLEKILDYPAIPQPEVQLIDLTMELVKKKRAATLREAKRYWRAVRGSDGSRTATPMNNKMMHTYDQEIHEYDIIISRSWVPPDNVTAPYLERLEYLNVLIATGAITPNKSLQYAGRKELRNSLWGVQRRAFEASRDHELGWKLSDWETTRQIPYTDGVSWLVSGDQSEIIWAWSPNDVYLEACTTQISELIIKRRVELEGLIGSLAGKHFSQFRSIVGRELARWGDATKGKAALVHYPAMTMEEAEQALFASLFSKGGHWMTRNQKMLTESVKFGMDRSKWCKSENPADHKHCDGEKHIRGGRTIHCPCFCHPTNRLTDEDRAELARKDLESWRTIGDDDILDDDDDDIL